MQTLVNRFVTREVQCNLRQACTELLAVTLAAYREDEIPGAIQFWTAKGSLRLASWLASQKYGIVDVEALDQFLGHGPDNLEA